MLRLRLGAAKDTTMAPRAQAAAMKNTLPKAPLSSWIATILTVQVWVCDVAYD